MTNIWYFVVPALIIAFIGTKIRKPDQQVFVDWSFPWGPATGCRWPGRILFLIGASASALGIYAAFKGPVQVGSLSLPKSTFITENILSMKEKKSAMKEKYSRKEAGKKANKYDNNPALYGKEKVSITGRWVQVAKASYTYKGTVHNRGDRALRNVTFNLKMKTGKTHPIGVGAIAANSSVDYEQSFSLHFWRLYAGGPFFTSCVYAQ